MKETAFKRLCLVVCLMGAPFWTSCSNQSPASLLFQQIVSPTDHPPMLGDIVTIAFAAEDSRGTPMVGVTVNFSLQTSQPGVSLKPTQTTTNSQGIALTQLVATGRIASVVVVATAGDKTALSPPISFAGSAPSASRFTFQCGPFDGPSSGSVHAIRAYDATRSLAVGVRLQCTAHVADRNGDGIPNAQVSFLTEAGTIGPTATSTTDGVGNADVLYKTSYPLPQAQDPGHFTYTPVNDDVHTGDYLVPLWMHPYRWTPNPIQNVIINGPNAHCADLDAGCDEPRRIDPERLQTDGGVYTNNPRDNLVTMIAVTAGEEAFQDLNDNGQWDPGEPYTDTTEPFVDKNDNGTWDPGEQYVDTNGNGKWDGKNGKYDSNTLIWVENKILWTGIPDGPDTDIVRAYIPDGGFQNIQKYGGSASFSFLVADPWFNSMAQDGQGDTCNVVTTGPVAATTGQTPVGMRLSYPPYELLGFTLTDTQQPPQDGGVPPPDVPYSGLLQCNLTDSPDQGGVVTVTVGLGYGTDCNLSVPGDNLSPCTGKP